MKKFIVFYEHRSYGYYSTKLEANEIQDALDDFIENFAYNKIYGIMEIS